MTHSKSNVIIIEAIRRGYVASKNGTIYTPAGKIRKTNVNSRGYKVFNLDRSVPVFVHKMVAYQKYGKKAFDKGVQVRHLNGDSLNNSWDNIAIGTSSQNHMDKKPEVRLRTSNLAASKQRSLTMGEANLLRSLKEQGWAHKALCDKFGLAKSTVSYIVNRRTYRD